MQCRPMLPPRADGAVRVRADPVAKTGWPATVIPQISLLNLDDLQSELRARDQDALREGRIDMESTHRCLMWHGMCLFLLGLLTGFAEPRFPNMRMGLAAHLEGLMNGLLLIAPGAVWIHVSLPL
jgi:hypothetical protein